MKFKYGDKVKVVQKGFYFGATGEAIGVRAWGLPSIAEVLPPNFLVTTRFPNGEKVDFYPEMLELIEERMP